MGSRHGVGEYGTPDSIAWAGRRVFLLAVLRVAPQTVDSLAQDVLPAYSPEFSAYQEGTRTFVCFADGVLRYVVGSGVQNLAARLAARSGLWVPSLSAGDDADKALAPFAAALAGWAGRWHLRDDWILNVALTTLDSLSRVERPCASWRFVASILRYPHYGGPMPAAPALTLDPWLPTTETYAAYRTRALSECARQLDEYLFCVDEHYDEAGFKLTPEYRALEHHAEWLVRYQVLEEEWPDIAATATRELADGRRAPVTDQAVRDAVKKTADLLGLTLREGRGPGRPAGSRTDPSKPSAGRVTKGTRR